jgi:hypothetical protein
MTDAEAIALYGGTYVVTNPDELFFEVGGVITDALTGISYAASRSLWVCRCASPVTSRFSSANAILLRLSCGCQPRGSRHERTPSHNGRFDRDELDAASRQGWRAALAVFIWLRAGLAGASRRPALVGRLLVMTLREIEDTAFERYTEACAKTNAIPWGAGGEASAIFNETACRDTWLRARARRQDAERKARFQSTPL